MAQLKGRSVVVKTSPDGTTFTAVGELNACDMGLAGATLDVTKFSDTFIEKIQGLRDCSWTLDGFYDPGDTSGQVAIRGALLNDTACYIEILFDGTAGLKQQVVPSKYDVKAAVAGVVAVSITLDGTGPVTAV